MNGRFSVRFVRSNMHACSSNRADTTNLPLLPIKGSINLWITWFDALYATTSRGRHHFRTQQRCLPHNPPESLHYAPKWWKDTWSWFIVSFLTSYNLYLDKRRAQFLAEVATRLQLLLLPSCTFPKVLLNVRDATNTQDHLTALVWMLLFWD